MPTRLPAQLQACQAGAHAASKQADRRTACLTCGIRLLHALAPALMMVAGHGCWCGA